MTSVGVSSRPPSPAEPSDPALFWRKTKLNLLAHWVEETASKKGLEAVLQAIEEERKSNAGI